MTPSCWRAVSLALFALVAPARAYSSFRDRIPNGRNVPGAQGVGHTSTGGGGSRNAFGSDFQSAGETWTTALCQKDSDGDGRSNGEELGDPSCKWKVGDTPSSSSVSHPGVSDAEPSAAADPGVSDAKTSAAAVSDAKPSAAAAESADLPVGARPGGMVPAWIIVHGVMMAIAWLVFVPLGITAAVLKRAPRCTSMSWFAFHYRAQMFASLLTIAAGIIAIVSYGASAGDANVHTIIGLIVFAAVIAQVLGGVVRPHVAPHPGADEPPPDSQTDGVARDPAVLIEDAQETKNTDRMPKTRARIVWEVSHKNVGRLLMVLAIINMSTGTFYALTKYR